MAASHLNLMFCSSRHVQMAGSGQQYCLRMQICKFELQRSVVVMYVCITLRQWEFSGSSAGVQVDTMQVDVPSLSRQHETSPSQRG